MGLHELAPVSITQLTLSTGNSHLCIKSPLLRISKPQLTTNFQTSFRGPQLTSIHQPG
jgi:hypothetical protein